ncbi:hypothetical protein [Vibrio phage XZ1]|uniref:Uncharacterized protein n=2 Tax=Schizotequatrovirus valkk3 TaxID=1914021 RepID=A0A0D4DBK0_9CAUD|nr:hypothetical protein AVU32_gp112 [Vibrio phage ValKK3]ALP47464.1 hypothetical protein phiST2_0018 [Vibrio phage phi-ST2]QBX06323.1 hypothetical protein Va3_370 [Vibrio phage Va3]QNJ54566.1 hypothetical protein vBValMR10Z_25 [Vibrio phage vB_ValM_R10Z]QNJ54951.1 hypothetical protein vBValMR11Z_25 [Vibrio phage vB_ValM_R11Z]UOL51380.1 hypothetical protein [Vibrio phage XZ1]URQ03732.1 hypothetical protein PVA23_355 [Vibrio phage PVA23]
MELKTFDEYKETELKEATIKQWAGRSALAGASLGAAFGFMTAAAGATATGGLAVAVPLATWGAISLGIHGLIGGALFAGGQARKDYSELKKTMKKIEKYRSLKQDDITEKKVAAFEKDLERSLFLVRKLRTSLNSDIDIATAKGVFRSDIKQSDQYLQGLEKMEAELIKIEKATKRAKKAAKKSK